MNHPLFTDREVAYIRRSPLLPETLAYQYGVPVEAIIAARRAPAHDYPCARCKAVSPCDCGHDPCLFKLCDDCQLAALDAEPAV